MSAVLARAITHPTTQPPVRPVPEPVHVELEGRRVGPYRLGPRIGRGGMGVVHTARDRHGRNVAVKLLHPHLSDDPELGRMFYDECALACLVDHPNVCRVYDFGRQGDLLYLAMEQLSGVTLGSVLEQRGALPVWLAARVISDAAHGLHAAHELTDELGNPLALVHRDVSPQNVVVGLDGLSKIVDFGVARTRSRAGSTEQGVLKGKLAYMAPEQLEELPLDRRADVWGLGVLLWESIAGERLFRRENEIDVVKAVLTADVPPLRSRRPDCPPALAAIVHRALEEEPLRRWATAADLANALDGFLAKHPMPSNTDRVSDWMCQFVEAPTVETDAFEDEPEIEDDATPEPVTMLHREALVAVGALAGVSGTLLGLLVVLAVIWGGR